MEKTRVFGIMLTILLMVMSTLVYNIQPVKASGTIYIRADGSIDPSTAPIQRNGDFYTFTDDVYGSVVIERSNLVIDGEGCIIQGDGSGDGFSLYSISNVTITNTIIMSFYYGVHLKSAFQNIVSKNIITANNWAGIELESSSNNIIGGNDITANGNYGIDLNDSFNNTISENDIELSAEMYKTGIRLALSNYNSIIGNNVTGNKNDGIWFLYSSNNVVIGNNVTGNNRDGIELDYSPNNSIIGNNVTGNGVYGAVLSDSPNNVVCGNNIKNNMFGIGLSDSSNNSISVNNITANENGVFLFGFSGSSNNSIFLNNIIANTNVGIKLYNSLRNIIFHNNFVNNQDQVIFVNESCVNVWDDGYPSGGNYWSDYVGVDLKSGSGQDMPGSDGIGDSQYVIDENNIDHYPLMNPTSAPPLSVSISPLSASINVGQSVTFTSTVSGGYTPYIYRWYLNGAPVSGATSASWIFTPTTSGIYYVHLKVTDAKDNTIQSETARITVVAVPVGGYTLPIERNTGAEPLALYLTFVVISAVIFTAIKRKLARKTKSSPKSFS